MIAGNWKQWNSRLDESGLGQGMNMTFKLLSIREKSLELYYNLCGLVAELLRRNFYNDQWTTKIIKIICPPPAD